MGAAARLLVCRCLSLSTVRAALPATHKLGTVKSVASLLERRATSSKLTVTLLCQYKLLQQAVEHHGLAAAQSVTVNTTYVRTYVLISFLLRRMII